MTPSGREPLPQTARSRPLDRAQAWLFGVLGRWVGRRRYASLARGARWLLLLMHPFNRKRRHIVRRNLELCFPQLDDAAREDLVRATLLANTHGLLDAVYAWHAPTLDHAEIARIDGLEHLHAAFAQERGVVFLSGHFPGSELVMRLLAEHAGRSIQPMVRRFPNPWLDARIDAARVRHLGGTLDRGDAQAFCRAVRNGHGVFYGPDVDVKRRNVFLPFFGVPASTLDSMHVLLRRSGGVVVPGWVDRDADGRLHIRIEAPWPDFPGRDGVAAAARYTAWVQEHVARNPAQYQWMVKRFKTRPPGEPDLYA